MNRNTLAALSLAAALTLSLAACGGGTTGIKRRTELEAL